MEKKNIHFPILSDLRNTSIHSKVPKKNRYLPVAYARRTHKVTLLWIWIESNFCGGGTIDWLRYLYLNLRVPKLHSICSRLAKLWKIQVWCFRSTRRCSSHTVLNRLKPDQLQCEIRTENCFQPTFPSYSNNFSHSWLMTPKVGRIELQTSKR